MSATARLIREGSIGLIELDNPPVNALAHGLRQGLGKSIDEALADPAITAIVLIGAGRMFCGGADLREFGTPAQTLPPMTFDIRTQMDASSKPIVAAIHGSALGGGLEMALACHYRIAQKGAQLGLPEVKRGLLPGGGGTQRLPRLVGVATATEMIIEGLQINTARALEIGLISEVVEGDLRAAAMAFAQKMAARGGPHPVISQMSASIDNAAEFFKTQRDRIRKEKRGLEAPLLCLDCIEKATTTPFAEGSAFERAGLQQLVAGTQSKALRHIFFAERESARIPGIAEDAPTRPIRKVGVLGAGTMGGGIAMSLVNVGIPVVQLETSQAGLDKGRATMSRNYAGTVAKGRLTQADMDKRLGLITGTLSYEDLKDCDLIIEAVFEEMSVKQEVFRKLDAVCKPGAILASNTSRLNIDQIAAATSRPEDVIGLHFFSPANVMRLLEVVRGARTSNEVIATSMKLGNTVKKLPILVGNCEGFVGNRMLTPYSREAQFVVEEGASPQQVDQALYRFGMAMGPLAVGDLAGLDIGWAGRKRLEPTRPKHLRYSKIADRICEMGRFGQKTGAGWYRYEAGSRTPLPDPVVDGIIEQCAREAGITRRAVTDEEIIERAIYAMVNEGARILEEGIALRASDIDLVYVNGYGFPAHRGGPMFYADTVGLDKVLARIRQFHKEHGELWTPAPLLEKLVREGKRFNA